MDKIVFGVSGSIILACIVGFFILSRVRKRMDARLLSKAQEAKTYHQLLMVLHQAPANSQAGKLAQEKVEAIVLEMAQNATSTFQLNGVLWMCSRDSPAGKLAQGKLEALREKEDIPPSRYTLLNKYAQEEFKRKMDEM